MTVAPATAPALRDEIAAALEHNAPAHQKVVVRDDQPDILLTTVEGVVMLAVEVVRYPLDYHGIARRERANAEARIPSVWFVDPRGRCVSLIERQLDPEKADYRYGEVIDVPSGAGRQWGLWLKVAGCEPC